MLLSPVSTDVMTTDESRYLRLGNNKNTLLARPGDGTNQIGSEPTRTEETA